MRIGIFGGSFNPIHNGHIEIAKKALYEAGLDKCLLCVANKPPHKETADNVPARLRFEMTYNALSPELPIYACSVEIEHGLSYTVDMLKTLTENPYYQHDRFYLIMGADMLCSFMTWRAPDVICSMIEGIIAVRRKGTADDEEIEDSMLEIKKSLGMENIILIDDVSELSSTQIRQRVYDALPITGMMPGGSERTVYENLLYQPTNIQVIAANLKNSLSKKRYLHCTSTMREAIALADKYGVDREKCRLAGLIHDCAKISCVDYIAMAERSQIELDEYDLASPPLIHAKLGEFKARMQYHITDKSVLDAVLFHTIASPDMDDVAKVVFIADKIEALRTYQGVNELRRAAHSSLDEGMLACLESSVDNLALTGKEAHPMTLAALKHFSDIVKK